MNEPPKKRRGRPRKYALPEVPEPFTEPAVTEKVENKLGKIAQFSEPKKRLLVVLPFTESDRNLALTLLGWIGTLGRQSEHSCLLIADVRQPMDQIRQVATRAALVFKRVDYVSTPFALPNETWPFGANWMFETALRTISTRKSITPFLWLEPDVVPMRRGWLEEIERTYFESEKPFMGQIVFPRKKGLPDRMLSGVAVYPADAHVRLLSRVVQQKMKKAFDVFTSDISVPHTWPTRLIWNFHGEPGLPPTFVSLKTPGSPRNAITPDRIPKSTALYHRCKDGSLIQLLRKTLT